MSRLSDALASLVSHTPVAFQVNDRIIINGIEQLKGTVRYVGGGHFKPGQWVGIELDAAVGKNDGSVEGVRYFQCTKNKGVFVRPDVVQLLSRGGMDAKALVPESQFAPVRPSLLSTGSSVSHIGSQTGSYSDGPTPLTVVTGSSGGRATPPAPPSPESIDNSGASVGTASTSARHISRSATPSSIRSAPVTRKLTTAANTARKGPPAPLQSPVRPTVTTVPSRGPKPLAHATVGSAPQRRPSGHSVPAVMSSQQPVARGRNFARPTQSSSAAAVESANRPRSVSRGRTASAARPAVAPQRQARSRDPMKRDRLNQPKPAPAASRVDKIVSPAKPAPVISTSTIAQAAAFRQSPPKPGISGIHTPDGRFVRSSREAFAASSSIASPVPVAGTVSVSADLDALLGGAQAGSLFDVLTRKHAAKPGESSPQQKPSPASTRTTDVANRLPVSIPQADRPPMSPRESKVVMRTEVAISELIAKALASSSQPLSPEGQNFPSVIPEQQSGLPSGESEAMLSPVAPRLSVPQPLPPPMHPPVSAPSVVAPPPIPPGPSARFVAEANGPAAGTTSRKQPPVAETPDGGKLSQPPLPPLPPSGSIRVENIPINLPDRVLLPASVPGASNDTPPVTVHEPASQLTLTEPEPHDSRASPPRDVPPAAAKIASDLLASVAARVDGRDVQDSGVQPSDPASTAEQFVYSIATFAGISEQGFGHDVRDKPNQDAIVMAEDPETGALLMAVFDGHGPFGHLVSDRLRVMIPPSLFGQPMFPTNMEQALQAAINEVENIILQDAEVDCTLSGSTAVMVVSYLDRLYVGNVGDSRAVLLKKQGSESEGFSLVPHPLSRDHKPQLPSETKRILLKGGHIASITYDDGVDGPPRVWLRDEGVPGLAMSRSVGDTIGKKAGVCSEVEFKEVALREEDVCVVVASDGLWEFLTNQLVADAVAAVAAETGGDETEWMKRSLQQLTLMATQSWSNAEGVTDDTSIILGLIGQTPV